MKKVLCIYLILSLLFLTSCSANSTYASQDAKNEYAQYYNGLREVAVIRGDSIYFEDIVIELNSLPVLSGSEQYNRGVLIYRDVVYFSTTCENIERFEFPFNIFDIRQCEDYSFKVYEYNLTSKAIKLIFEKDGYKTGIRAYADDGVFYIRHYIPDSNGQSIRQIDKYSIGENKYDIVDISNNYDLEDFRKAETPFNYCYEVQKETSKSISITDLNTKKTKIIDADYLSNTKYAESLKQFNYWPIRVNISEGHILLTYTIGAHDAFNYSNLVFEYNFETDTLEYKLLAFPADNIYYVKSVYLDDCPYN